MQRWMASAAGGTSQRLKPGFAMIRSRASRPHRPTPLPVVSIAAITRFLQVLSVKRAIRSCQLPFPTSFS